MATPAGMSQQMCQTSMRLETAYTLAAPSVPCWNFKRNGYLLCPSPLGLLTSVVAGSSQPRDPGCPGLWLSLPVQGLGELIEAIVEQTERKSSTFSVLCSAGCCCLRIEVTKLTRSIITCSLISRRSIPTNSHSSPSWSYSKRERGGGAYDLPITPTAADRVCEIICVLISVHWVRL